MKKIVSIIITTAMLLSTLLTVSTSAAPKVYYQNNNQSWSTYPYGKGDTGLSNNKATIATSGCMLLSLTNAVYHLTGNFLEPTMLADFAIKKKCRVNFEGTHDCFVKHAAEEFGSKYGFKYVKTTNSEADLKNALQNGQTAVWHTSGHFLAIVDYNASNKKYLILDSYPSSKRGTTGGYAWKTFSQIKNMGIKAWGSYKGFMLIAKTTATATTKTPDKPKNETINWPATKNIKTYVVSTQNNTTVYKTASSSQKYGTIYANDLITINGYSGSRLKVTYPVSGGTKTGYIDKSKVTGSAINKATAKKTASSKITAYRRSSGNAELGYISKGDVYYEIASKNGRKQVIYPISGGYKMGWIK